MQIVHLLLCSETFPLVLQSPNIQYSRKETELRSPWFGRWTLAAWCGWFVAPWYTDWPILTHYAHTLGTSPLRICFKFAFDFIFNFQLKHNKVEIRQQGFFTHPSVVIVTIVYQKEAGMLVNLLELEPFSA